MANGSSDYNAPAIAAAAGPQPIIIFDPSLTPKQRPAELARRLELEDVQATLRAAAAALIPQDSGSSWGGSPPAAPGASDWRAESPPPDASNWSPAGGWGEEKPTPLVIAQEGANQAELSGAYFDPWLPLAPLGRPARLFHRLKKESALAPAFLVLIGFALAQFIANPELLQLVTIPSAYAVPLVQIATGIDPARLRLYLQLGLFALVALLVFVAFFWSLMAASSKQARTAALGAKVFGQILTFMFGALTGFLAT
ncbi:MAG: hypothetical protein AB7M12_13255 [Hyphomonadaceae bacterium]